MTSLRAISKVCLAVAGLSLAACTHEIVRAPVVPASARRTAARTVMSTQISNAVNAGEGDLEATKLRQRLASDATDLNARVMLARLYNRRGLPDLALEHYRLAATQFPDSPVAALELAKTLRQMNAPGEALVSLDQATGRMPNSWALISLQGVLQDESGNLAAAETAHRKALSIDQGRAPLHNNLGYNLLLQGKASDAATELRRAVEIDPRSQVARNNLGAALAAGSQSKEALTEWQRSGDAAGAHNNLGAVLMQQGKDAEAREEMQTALRLRPAFPPAMANLRLLAVKTGENVEVPLRNSSWWSWMSFWNRGHKQMPKAAETKAAAKSS